MKLTLKNVRIVWPKLVTPVPFEAGGTPRYSATFVVDKDNVDMLAHIDEVVEAVAKDKYGAKAAANVKAFKANPNKYFVKDGDLKPGFEGMWMVSSVLNSPVDKPKKVIVLDQMREPMDADTANKITGGDYVDVAMDIWAQEGQYSGIRSQLLAVRFLKKGDPLGGGGATVSAADFDEIEIDEDEELI